MTSDHTFYTGFPKLGKLPSINPTNLRLNKLHFLRLLLITESAKNRGSFFICIKKQMQNSYVQMYDIKPLKRSVTMENTPNTPVPRRQS